MRLAQTKSSVCCQYHPLVSHTAWQLCADRLIILPTPASQALTAATAAPAHLLSNSMLFTDHANQMLYVSQPLYWSCITLILLAGVSAAGDAAFLDLYQQLSEAPDPAPALAAALDAETQLAQLTAQVTEAFMPPAAAALYLHKPSGPTCSAVDCLLKHPAHLPANLCTALRVHP